jgi:hypothetical protein
MTEKYFLCEPFAHPVILSPGLWSVYQFSYALLIATPPGLPDGPQESQLKVLSE